MIGTERALADAIADGRITEDDAEEVRAFAELLSQIRGPREVPTVAELIAMENYSHDRDPEFAEQIRRNIDRRWVRECQ